MGWNEIGWFDKANKDCEVWRTYMPSVRYLTQVLKIDKQIDRETNI